MSIIYTHILKQKLFFFFLQNVGGFCSIYCFHKYFIMWHLINEKIKSAHVWLIASSHPYYLLEGSFLLGSKKVTNEAQNLLYLANLLHQLSMLIQEDGMGPWTNVTTLHRKNENKLPQDSVKCTVDFPLINNVHIYTYISQNFPGENPYL